MVETTPWHLFLTQDGWTEAEDLRQGDAIVSLGGVYGTVDSVIIENTVQMMYDLTVEDVHTFAVGEGDWVVHNLGCGDYPDSIVDPETDQTYNRPNLPSREIASQGSIRAEHYYHTNDHAPAHVHIVDGNRNIKVGPNGIPLSGQGELSPAMRRFVQRNLPAIRRAVTRIQAVVSYRNTVDRILGRNGF